VRGAYLAAVAVYSFAEKSRDPTAFQMLRLGTRRSSPLTVNKGVGNATAARCVEALKRELTGDGVVVMKRILGPALAGVTLAACGPPQSSPQVTTTGAESSAVVTDCGTFDVPQGSGLPDSAARCLVDAVQAGHPARLKETRLSSEGDPIPVAYTASDDGRVELITDLRQDRFGPRIITRQTCSGPIATPGLHFAECSDPTPIPE
jgi:hypothetical protein